MEAKITEAEIREIAQEKGPQYAHDLLLLGGPDWLDGDYGKYTDLLEELLDDAWDAAEEG